MDCNSAGLKDLSSLKNKILVPIVPKILPRFLCVSNGYEIFCLDLNKGRQQPFRNVNEIPLIPRIGTIDLMKEGLPVSVGLFPLGSQIYIIGGQKFQVSIVDEPHENVPNANPMPSRYVQRKDSKLVLEENTMLFKYFKDRENSLLSKGFFHLGPDLYRIDEKPLAWSIGNFELWGGDPKGINLYKALCVRCLVKPSSRDIYDVSLAEGNLSFSKSEDIAPLEKPKLWPIIETINGQTHVIDSVPLQLTDYCKGWISSHEVLSRDNKSWSEVLFKENIGYITSHLVLGSRIYVITEETRAVFDSETEQWDAMKGNFGWKSPYSANSMWDILDNGIGRCVGGVVYGEPKNPLYVVIALVEDYISHDVCIVVAIAYLVTSDGLVVCWQLLSDFFEGPVKPECIEGGTIIDVDENGLTLCSIISGTGTEDVVKDYVYINTFTAKGVTDEAAMSEVQKVWEEGENAWPVERDFVRVELWDKYVYESHDGVESRGMLGVRACLFP